MPWESDHSSWFIKIVSDLTTSDGKEVAVIEFNPDLGNLTVMSKWAKHFRNHYCFDSEIDFLKDGTNQSRKEYLLSTKFPTANRGFGPGIRAGDFGEILVADYLEYCLNYWVPRTRYGNKTIRDESTKGTDLIAFKIVDDTESIHDVLQLVEVKAQFSGNPYEPRLQDAINDSAKDELRKAESLNAIKQRYFDKNKLTEANKIKRFQNQEDKPYTEEFGAVAIFISSAYDDEAITTSTTDSHPKKDNLSLIVMRGDNLMEIVHTLYQIAADEA